MGIVAGPCPPGNHGHSRVGTGCPPYSFKERDRVRKGLEAQQQEIETAVAVLATSEQGVIMKWEYKIVFFTIEPLENEEEYEGRLHNGVHVLNELGAQGWELVQFVDHPITKNAWKHHAVMKRPLA